MSGADTSRGRLLVLASEFPPGPGGIGTHAHQVATGLRRLGWDVEALVSQDYVPTDEAARFNGAQPFRVSPFRRVPGAPFKLAYRELALGRSVRRFRPDVMVVSGGRAVILAAARPFGRRVPWVAVGHGTEFGGRSGWAPAAIRWAFGKASAVVCVSEFTRGQMRRAGVRTRRDLVIPNGADASRFRALSSSSDSARLRQNLGLPPGPLLLTVGNVTPRKGQDIVVRALAKIRAHVPDVQYAIVGMPTTGEEIRKIAADLGVADAVHLIGRVDEAKLVQTLNAADVFVMTSRYTADGDFEGYGIAVIEAALCGLPAVVAEGSGLAEAVRHGVTGFCVPSEDPDATARAICSLLQDEPLRREMGGAARRRAEEEQTWDRRMPAYDALLREVAR